MNRTVILTRPSEASARFAEACAGQLDSSWRVMISPLMQTSWLTDGVRLPSAGGLIFTAETAVRAFCRLSERRDLTAWCVGPRTQKAAEQAGMRAITGPGTAADLAKMIGQDRGVQPLLWLRGADVAFDMEKALKDAGVDTVSATLYRQEPLPFSDAAAEVLQGSAPVLLPLFSPRSTRLVREAAPTIRAPLFLVAMSEAVAAEAALLKPARIVVADRPEGESMLIATAALARDIVRS
ncbi:MAG: uroporphyrinogen-III synthase [Paracoccaceae bacterium]